MAGSLGTLDVRAGCQANAWARDIEHAELKHHLDDVLGQVRAAGYDGVELPVWAIPDFAQPAALRDLLARHGLAFISIHLGGSYHDAAVYREQTLPALRRATGFAAAAGAEGMVIGAIPKRTAGAAPGTHERKTAEELRLEAMHLAEAARQCRDLGLATWYHNHWAEFDHDAEELRAILDIDPALLSLCFDIGNAARALPGAALLETMAHHWDRIGQLHYKDIKGDTLAEALGEGDLDFDTIGALARERGFHGWAVAEIENARGMLITRSTLEDATISAALIRRTLGMAPRRTLVGAGA